MIDAETKIDQIKRVCQQNKDGYLTKVEDLLPASNFPATVLIQEITHELRDAFPDAKAILWRDGRTVISLLSGNVVLPPAEGFSKNCNLDNNGYLVGFDKYIPDSHNIDMVYMQEMFPFVRQEFPDAKGVVIKSRNSVFGPDGSEYPLERGVDQLFNLEEFAEIYNISLEDCIFICQLETLSDDKLPSEYHNFVKSEENIEYWRRWSTKTDDVPKFDLLLRWLESLTDAEKEKQKASFS